MTAINIPSLNSTDSAESQGAAIGKAIDEVRAKVVPVMEKFNTNVLALMQQILNQVLRKQRKKWNLNKVNIKVDLFLALK